jgi:hypothetical protein
MSIAEILRPSRKTQTAADEPPPAPAVPVDPIQALADARALAVQLGQQLTEIKAQIAALPPSKMSPAAMSMTGGVDVLARQAEDAQTLLRGEALGPYASGSSDLFRQRDALNAAIEQQGQAIARLTIDAGGAIYTRDFESKHRKALKRLAAAMIELREAAEAELAVAGDAMRAGCFPAAGGFSGMSIRPGLRNVPREPLRALLASLQNAKLQDLL